MKDEIIKKIVGVTVLHKVQSEYSYMVLITCKKCGDINYLTSEALGKLTDFGYKCRNCNTINRITLEDGELKKQE
jgi:RNase P subunit RPR2